MFRVYAGNIGMEHIFSDYRIYAIPMDLMLDGFSVYLQVQQLKWNLVRFLQC